MRYFIGFLLAIFLIILLIFLLFSGGGNGGKKRLPTTPKALSSYASTDAQTSVLIDGPINGDLIHQQIKIVVTKNKVIYQQIQGYEGNVVNEQQFPSNQNAYSAFLSAIGRAGFTRGKETKLLSSEAGYCPLGNRYIFELNQNGTQLERFWATNCGSAPRTFNGSVGLTLTLFQAQVPGYQDLTQNVNIQTQ